MQKRVQDRLTANRLDLLAERLRSVGPSAYWVNGQIRTRRLHPTKGWRTSRVEEYMPGVVGYLTARDAEKYAKKFHARADLPKPEQSK